MHVTAASGIPELHLSLNIADVRPFMLLIQHLLGPTALPQFKPFNASSVFCIYCTICVTEFWY